MKEVSNRKIVALAKKYTREKTPWHNHFLAVDGVFNKSGKFQVVVESEGTGEVFVSHFKKQPTPTLKLLEELFFQQKKDR